MPLNRVWNFLLLMLFASLEVFSQTLPVGTPVLEDAYRRSQLLGQSDSLSSFTIRPISNDGNQFMETKASVDSVKKVLDLLYISNKYQFHGGKGVIRLLPITYQRQYNSLLPYGWNDGAMIPSKGIQTHLSTGVYAQYGPLSIQLKPEYVNAENLEYDGFAAEQFDIVWANYYDKYYNVSEITDRFNDEVYNKLNWGQSSIRLTFDPVSIGLSNENLWWGPGHRNSLIMTNNAPGFKHITLNTSRPVQTKIGSFEAQIIAGRLENSGVLPPEVNRVYEQQALYIPKRDDWRYLSGLVFTFNPKWTPGLFIGASRVSQMYNQDSGKSPADFLPLLQPFESKLAAEARDRYSTLFFRWVLKEAHAEIYGEYGHQGKKSFGDFLKEPDRNAAYMWGVRKLFPWSRRRAEFLQVFLEFTELQQAYVPVKGGWYTSTNIRQGYTHNGQVLGAGIGPGSNLQTLNISWVKGLKRIGVQGERYLHNNDFYYQMFINPPDYRKHYVDMSASAFLDWDFKNFILSAKGTVVRSLNYQYVLYNRPTAYFVTGWDRINYQASFGLTYRF
ncbi:capsule assembly Wzi family protein [Daejeonella sp.]|uniref:capsule assembly Wzi family protein n=1 Tax=Daejeonella sp. TaxID=2805397 RepID=UPI0025C6BF9C|nr:capsule assembly Wzi family protein [Daejeonella sp.]